MFRIDERGGKTREEKRDVTGGSSIPKERGRESRPAPGGLLLSFSCSGLGREEI